MSVRLRPFPDAPTWPRGLPEPERGRLRRARHVLVVPAGVEIEEIEMLALSRFAGTRWLREPAVTPEGLVDPGAIRTSRHTTLVGPYAPPGSGGMIGGFAFDVDCPRERGAAPVPGTGDRDGIGRAFAAGLPVREEARVVSWLVAAARRLCGLVLFDDAVVVRPDPEAQIDLTVYSDVWLAPQAALALVGAVDDRAVFAPTGVDWAGPPPGTGEGSLPGGVALDPRQREALHAAADEFDIAALRSDAPASGYAVHVDLGPDGLVAVEIGGEELLPVSLRGLPWADGGAVAYRVRWHPEQAEQLELEEPSIEHRAQRARAAQTVAAVTSVIHEAARGEITDAADFLVHPEDLAFD